MAASCSRGGRIDIGLLDRDQVLGYDLAAGAVQVRAGQEMLAYGEGGEWEGTLAAGFAGEVVADLAGRTAGRHTQWGLDGDVLHSDPSVSAALHRARDPELWREVAARVAVPVTGHDACAGHRAGIGLT
ncbi:MAG: hypothetical protein GEU78_10600 [Actinobacteria bacterium]|nr:hypothetical protein [Actinomycetota bacterium]